MYQVFWIGPLHFIFSLVWKIYLEPQPPTPKPSSLMPILLSVLGIRYHRSMFYFYKGEAHPRSLTPNKILLDLHPCQFSSIKHWDSIVWFLKLEGQTHDPKSLMRTFWALYTKQCSFVRHQTLGLYSCLFGLWYTELQPLNLWLSFKH